MSYEVSVSRTDIFPVTTNVFAFGSNVEALRIEQTAPKGKPVLSDERFKKALEALKNKKTTVEAIKRDYKLNDSQLLKLDEV